ncbi:MAG TPA: hypothetical protein VKY65_15520 [Alphaproteobacteria bacterium]|nr:hypothetical protein [Alphaproteobacteria bacterium]
MSRNGFWPRASLAFAAGNLGALANRVALWVLGVIAVISPPNITKLWLYTALVWGGLWGFLFLIPWRTSWWLRGLVFGLGPSAGVWLVIYPFVAHAGFFGLSRGPLSIVIPFVVNSVVWGLVTSWWYEYVRVPAA